MADVDTGKLVVAALTREALPVLRFQTAGLTRVDLMSAAGHSSELLLS